MQGSAAPETFHITHTVISDYTYMVGHSVIKALKVHENCWVLIPPTNSEDNKTKCKRIEIIYFR